MRFPIIALGDKYTVRTICPECRKREDIEITKKQYFDYESGHLAQNVFPEMTSDQREQLISGFCKICWDKLFEDNE